MSSAGSITIPALLGPWLVGFLFGSLLEGVDICVLFTYFKNYSKDNWFNKVIIILLFCLALGEHVEAYVAGWYLFITARSNDEDLNKTAPGSLYLLAGPVFAAMLTHIFFIRRAWRLSGNKWFVLIGLGLCACLSLGSGIAMLKTIIQLIDDGEGSLVKLNRVSTDLKKQKLTLSMFNWCAAGTDLIICATLSFLLLSEKKGFNKQTDTLLNRIVQLAVSTAGLTAVFAMAEALCVTTQSGKNNSNVAVNQPITHVYFLSVSLTLLMRDNLRDAHPVTSGKGSSNDKFTFSRFSKSQKTQRSQNFTTTTGVKVDINVNVADQEEENGEKTWVQSTVEKQEALEMV